MNTSKDYTRYIQIANIPIETTEHQLRELFSAYGQIVSLEIDPQVSRNTRSARLQFHDGETATIAIEQLDGHTINRKQLSVTHVDRFASKPSGQQIIGSGVLRGSNRPLQGSRNALNDTQIYNIIGSMTEKEQAEILVEFKNLATNHPEQIRQLLIDSPQFSHAILTLMTIFQLVDQDTIKTFTDQRHQSKLAQQSANPNELTEDEQKFYQQWSTFDETKRQALRGKLSGPIENTEGSLKNLAVVFKSLELKLGSKL